MRPARVVEDLSGGFELAQARMVDAPRLPHSAKSPLRYPGGKFRAVAAIKKHIPAGTDKLAAPFLGGGNVELSCAADGIKVFGADAFEPLVNFWQQAQDNPLLLAERVRGYHPLTKVKFYNLQKGYAKLTDALDRAAVFYALNRSSFSGTTLSGGMSPGHPRFNPAAIDRLRDFSAPNLSVRRADYKDTIRQHADKLLYLDPPYANGERLYGARGDMHDGFNHEELAAELRERDGWLLSYNDCRQVRDLYAGYRLLTPAWNYGMSGDKQSKELLIVNA